MMKKIILLTLVALPLMLGALATPEKTVPLDPSIIQGQLENGLNWYIRPNNLPQNRIELRLIVRAGSILEREDQRGIAHFLEHMAFNGTKKYPKNELIDYLQSLGMEFGPDINAHTSFDETVYQLTINNNNPGELEEGLTVLEEWAFNITLTEEEINKERPVILEERRMGRDATGRMRDKNFPIIFHNSLYGERLPIGLPEVIENAPLSAFQDFYDDWYRPDLMSVVIVGDMDPLEAESLIEKHFASYKVIDQAPERLEFPVPDHEGPLFSIQTDPEATTASLEIINKFEPVTTDTPEAWDRYFSEQLFSIMFSTRISEKLREPNPAFINGYASSAGYTRDKHLFQWGVMTNPGGLQRGFRSFWTEVERVRRYGFTQSELDRAGDQIMASYEYLLKEKLDSSTLTSIISSALSTGDSLTPLNWEYEQLLQLLSHITPQDVRRTGDKWFTDRNRVISFMGNEKAPTENQIRQIMIEIKESELAPWEEGKSFSSLMDQRPRSGSIVKKEYDQDLDMHIWYLSNGAKVVLKDTDFKENEILFSALSPGGASLVGESDLISAMLAPAAVSQSGLGMMTLTELQQFMAGKTLSLSPSIGDYWESLNGFSVPDDLEYLFQLVYLYFNSPVYRPSSWDSYNDRLTAYLAEQDQNPMELYSRLLNETVYMAHPRAKMLTAETLQEMNYDRAYDIFRQRFFDGDDFTFFFVGALDLDLMEDLTKTYLASLISVEGNEKWEDVGLRYNKSYQRREVEAGIEDKGMVTLCYNGEMDWSYEEAYKLSALGDSLENRLLETVREEFGGTYTISVAARSHLIPVPEYTIYIQFSCDPERIEELITLVKDEVELFRGDLDLTTYASDTSEAKKRSYQENLEKNSWYLYNLSYTMSRGLDPALIYTGENLAQGIDGKTMKETALKYLHTERMQEIILKPELLIQP